MIVDVGHLVVLAKLRFRAAVPVSVIDGGVVVLVDVVVGAMIEDAKDLAGLVMMRDVIVVVHVLHGRMDVLVLGVADDALLGLDALGFRPHLDSLRSTPGSCSTDASEPAPASVDLSDARPGGKAGGDDEPDQRSDGPSAGN
ncbi:MAG: hypothetical protein ACRDGT_03405 [Candidatus Limnocylindria bacterium]